MWGWNSPGRFFAANELKCMLAHVVAHYDVKLPGDTREIPEQTWFGYNLAPSRTAEVMFRKRQG